MPSHYGNSEPEIKSDPKKKSNGMRKLTDKEKKLVKEHFEKHQPDADSKVKASVRMKLMRSKEVKSMKGLHKVVGF